MADIRTGNHKAVGMNGVGRVGHQNRIARTRGRERKVRQPLLGTERDDRFGGRVERYVKALPGAT